MACHESGQQQQAEHPSSSPSPLQAADLGQMCKKISLPRYPLSGPEISRGWGGGVKYYKFGFGFFFLKPLLDWW